MGWSRKCRPKPTVIDGIKFRSKHEAKRYVELKLMERAGLIRGLTLQPLFPLIVNGVKVGRYTADFQYFEIVTNLEITEDAKQYLEPAQKFRLKVFKALYPHVNFRIT